MNNKVIDMEPCRKCQEYMRKGIILIEIDLEKSTPDWNIKPPGEEHWMPNPYRTGGFFVVTDEGVRHGFPNEYADWLIKHRFGFIDKEAATATGLRDITPVGLPPDPVETTPTPDAQPEPTTTPE